MTERELRRTAVIIPPKGRAVLCVWAAVPGLLAAPFVFWQGILPGLVFAALWAVLVFLARCRACSFAAVLGPAPDGVFRHRAAGAAGVPAGPSRASSSCAPAAAAGRGLGAHHLGPRLPDVPARCPRRAGRGAGPRTGGGAAMTTPNPRPSFPTEEKRFHPFAALRFLRKTLAVYLIPSSTCCLSGTGPHSGRLCGRTPSCLPCSAG